MASVTGIGGIFFKARDPAKLQAWYEEHLGLTPDAYGGIVFQGGDPTAQLAWSPFPADTTYFGPGANPYMINYRVDDLDGMLTKLRAAGAVVDDCVQEEPYGRFGWASDPEGNRFELWEPAP